MKVYVFKPTNEPIGKFIVSALEVEELERELALFAEGRTVPRYAYLECGVRTWTVVDVEDGLRIEEGRVRPEVDPNAPIMRGPSLVRRYMDRYRRSRSVVGAGWVIKLVAVLVVIVVFGRAMSGPFREDPFVALFAALSAGAPVFVLGIVVGVLGEILRATLDSAVHSSPFLDESEKALLLETQAPANEEASA